MELMRSYLRKHIEVSLNTKTFERAGDVATQTTLVVEGKLTAVDDGISPAIELEIDHEGTEAPTVMLINWACIESVVVM